MTQTGNTFLFLIFESMRMSIFDFTVFQALPARTNAT